MADNPFSVSVVNPLQALLLGQQSYASGLERNKQAAKETALADVGRMIGAGDRQGAIAKLLGVGEYQGANSISSMDQNEWSRRHTTERDAATDRHQRVMEGIALRSANRADDRTPAGFERDPSTGGYRPSIGGPADPAYISKREAAEGKQGNLQQVVEQRKAMAIANGLDPSSPGFMSFVLTGKMPREDAQPLTATDKKAILEADEAVLANTAAIDSLKRASKLSESAFEGPTAGARGYMASFLGKDSDIGKAGIATENLTNEVMTNALGQLKAIFGGAPTEGERKILLDMQGAATKPHDVRVEIFNRAQAAAEKRLEFNRRRAEELRGGQFYKPQGGMTRAPVAQTQGITQAQYEALPSGSVFTAPDGTQRVKP